MPEHHSPDTGSLDLDRAFDSLTRDFAHHPGPGPASAISRARTRRRTRVTVAALAAAAIVAGGVAAPRLVVSQHGVAADGGSARLDVEALAGATTGWITDWETWERYSPYGGGSFGATPCATEGGVSTAPEPVASGRTRFVTRSGSSAVVVIMRYGDARAAAAAERLSRPTPGGCGDTTTYDVDGVQVRHDSMRPPADLADDMWLGDVWTAQVGADRAVLEVVNDGGVADDVTAEEVAETLVAGLRDGWTESGMDPVR